MTRTVPETNIVEVYWNAGGFYLAPEPHVWHKTEASAYRRASEMGFTHLRVFHGYYSLGKKEFVVNPNIEGRIVGVPKRYRMAK